jgi:peptidoglycan/xylan/chitin deacetylase (PgdA/CDA1 family)
MSLATQARRALIRTLAAVRPASFPAALMYHSVCDSGPTFRVNRRDFLSQLDVIRSRTLLSLSAAVGPAALPDSALAVTFDDGYLDNYEFAIPACVDRGIPVTLFVAWNPLGSQSFRGGLPMMSRDHVRELASLPGVTIGSHTLSHPKLSRLAPAAQRAEITDSRRVLEDWLGRSVETFCYPFGDHDATTVALVREAGYSLAVTTKVGAINVNDAYRIPRVPVNEFTSPVFSATLRRGFLDYARLTGKT